MKKFILFFFAMVLSTVTGFAKDVVFDVTVNPGQIYYDDEGSKAPGDQSITIDGVTIAASNVQWDQQYRIYKDTTLTVTSTVGPIAKIEFTCTASGDAKYGPGCFSAMEGYSYDGAIGTWVGEAEQVAFHAESNQVRATRIVVTLAEPADPVVFSEVVDGGIYAIVNVQPTDPIRYYWLNIVDDSLEPVAGPDLTGHYAYPETAQYKAILLDDGRWAFENVATGNYLAWRNHNGQGGNGNKGYATEINELSSWTMNKGTLFSDLCTYWFYVNKRSETNSTAGTLLLSNNGYWNAWGATECNNALYSNDFGFVACAGEVDFTKVNVASVAEEASETIDPAKWYLVKQARGGVSPIYDKAGSVFRASSDNVVAAGVDAADVVDYLVHFVPAGEEDVYNIQFANGRYFADGSEASNSTPVTTTEEEPGLFNVKYILDTPGHFGIYAYNMGAVIDNNGKGNSVVYWGSGAISDKVDGNNDFKIYEVEFAPKTTAAADLKALISEVEAAYNANNAVVEVGEGIITSTDQFSSEYTDEQEGSLANLLDGDGSTFWHSTWHHGDNTPMHVHYLQVEFAEPISGDFELNMNRRVNGTTLCQNDNPVKMSVETSVDGVEFVLADEFDTPLTQTAAAPLVQVVFNIPTAAKYLRFFADECNGGNNRGYWHCGDLQIKPVVTPAPNAAHAEAAAAFAEALAAAKACGANATDADVAALQAAYDAYVAALTAAPADQYVLNFDKDLQQKSDDRHVTGFKLNDQQVTFPTYTTVYLDATDQVMEVTAGEELKPAIIWDGAWMHGVVYVDLDNDGSFYEEGDLVAHSPYTGNQNLATSISTFNAPTKEGVYRMRVKTDWIGDSQHMDGGGLDPAGRIGDDGTMEGNNSIWANRGRIIDLVLKVVEASEPESFPKAGVAYKIKNVDAKLWINLINDDTQNVTLSAAPQKIFFEAVEGGYTIKNEAGYVMGEHTKAWNIANTATPIVWTLEEAEGGYYLRNSKGLLGFDAITVGCKGFRNKGLNEHPLLSILEYDAVEPLTFEFAKNENGTITVTPSDNNRVYFYDIYSEDIRNEYYNGMNTVDCAKDAVANWLNTPDLETHKGVTTVDPKAWLTYFLGYDIVPGDYQLVAVAVDGAGDNWTVAGDVVVYDFSYAVKGKAELWEQYLALLDKMKQALIANKLDVDNLKDFDGPVAGKPGYKPLAKVHNLAVMYKTFSNDVWNAGSYEKYESYGYSIEDDMATCQQFYDEYLEAPICLPEAGKTYVIRNYPYTYSNDYSYAYYYNGSKLALSESANATTAEYMWTVSEPVQYTYFDADLNVIEETRYQFVNAADNTKYMSWRGAGTDNYAGVTTNAADANSKWYLTGKKVDGSDAPAYGTLALRTNADGNQYRTAVVDMRKSTDHLSKSNGDHFDATYSSWFIFEEVEIPITNWTGEFDPEKDVVVLNNQTVKVTFPEAHSVEATNFGVLAAIYDEQGDVYGVVFNDLFGDTVEFGQDCAVLHFKKISEINAELAEAAKGAAAKITAAAPGVDVAGKVVIASKSFKIDGESIYNDVIVKDFEFNAGNVTGIDAIGIDADAKIYDLQGRRVVVPAKGLLIRNGAKVVR